MIRYLCGEEKRICRELWEEAFREDSASFTDYYFTHVLKRNRILADVEDGRVSSMLHMNPYDLWVRGRVWRTEYLVGVATREELRRRGYMRRLLTRAMRDLFDEEAPFCFLMPADEAVYRPFGFARIARVPRRELVRTAGLRRSEALAELRARTGDGKTENTEDIRGISAWMEDWLKRRYQVFALRGEDYLSRLLEEVASEDGTFDVLYEDRDIAALESVWGLEEREQRLLYGDAPFVRELPAAGPVMMARILNLQKFVGAVRLRDNIRAEERMIPLLVQDELFPENSGNWLWYLNHETSRLERAEDAPGEDAPGKEPDAGGGILRLGIDRLAAWLFGCEVLPEAGEYGEIADVLNGVLLDEVV